jgi:DNA-binding CsgD family transcriptional regulator
MFHALRAADLRAALDCLGAIIEATAADRSFARQGVASLGRLVASDLTTLSICDLETGHRSVVSDVPGAISKRDVETFDRYFHEHPLVRSHGHNPAAVTRRISDLVADADFRRTPLYNDYYRSIRIDRAMAVPIHVHRHVLVSFVLNRSGREFSARDLECLEAIRPHLGHLYRLTRAAEGPGAAWGVPSPDPGVAVDPRLTAREHEVLDWLSGGKTDRDIADILGISPRTVHKHLQRIYEKLGVETRTAAVMRACGVQPAQLAKRNDSTRPR